MKQLGLLLIIIFISSCGKNAIEAPFIPTPGPSFSPIYSESNNYFSQYTNAFLAQYSYQKGSPYTGIVPPINFYDLSQLSYINNSSINISNDMYNGTTGQKVAGVCLEYESGDREILIDEQIWNQLGSDLLYAARKRAIIFHELGHCILNRPHQDELYRNYKTSIMNSVLIRQVDAQRWETSYDIELFRKDTTSIKSAINIYLDN